MTPLVIVGHFHQTMRKLPLLKNFPFASLTTEKILHFLSLILILPSSGNDPTGFLTLGKTDFLSWLLVIISQPLPLEGNGTNKTVPYLLSALFSAFCFIPLNLHRSAFSIPSFTWQNMVPHSS